MRLTEKAPVGIVSWKATNFLILKKQGVSV